MARWQTMLRPLLLLLGCVIYDGPVFGEIIQMPVDYNGRPIQVPLTYEKPQGPGPFALVILLPGCSAEVDRGLPLWANQLHAWGYATLRIEGMAVRGLANICDNLDTMKAIAVEQSKDVFAAARTMEGRPDIVPNKIAVLGRSLGSNGIVWYVTRDLPLVDAAQAAAAQHGGKIVAAIAVMPNCSPNAATAPVAMPLLILAGGLDDWNLASQCADFASAPGNAVKVRIKIYPTATHGWDWPGANTIYFGHKVIYNLPATQDSYAQARAFLDQYLH